MKINTRPERKHGIYTYDKTKFKHYPLTSMVIQGEICGRADIILRLVTIKWMFED